MKKTQLRKMNPRTIIIILTSIFITLSLIGIKTIKANEVMQSYQENGLVVNYNGELTKCEMTRYTPLRLNVNTCTIENIEDLIITNEGRDIRYWKVHEATNEILVDQTVTEFTFDLLNTYSSESNTNKEVIILTYVGTDGTTVRQALKVHQDKVQIKNTRIENQTLQFDILTFYYNLTGGQSREGNVSVSIYNQEDKLVLSEQLIATRDQHQFSLPLDQLQAGNYQIMINVEVEKQDASNLEDVFMMTYQVEAVEQFYNVIFDLNGGTSLTELNQIVRYNDLIQTPNEPSKVGYQFIGWNDENGLQWDFNTMRMEEKDLILIAHWEVIEETKIDSEDKEVVEITPDTNEKEEDNQIETPQVNETTNTNKLPDTGLSSNAMMVGLIAFISGTIIISKRKK